MDERNGVPDLLQNILGRVGVRRQREVTESGLLRAPDDSVWVFILPVAVSI